MSLTLRQPVEVTTNRVAHRSSRSEVDGVLDDTVLIDRFREVLAMLDLPSTARHPFTIGVTAALYDEGATSVAVGVATTLAYDRPDRVTIADCDLGWPSLHRRLAIPPTPGIGELVAGRALTDEALRQTCLPNLTALSAGRRPKRGIQEAARVQQWLTRYKQEEAVDYLVLDLPPVNVDLGTAVLASTTDALILVVRGGATPRDELKAALVRLGPRPVAGIVINQAQPALPGWLTRLFDAVREGG